jgi:hypothetical protein
MLFALFPGSFPKEPDVVFIEANMSHIRKQEEAHHVKRQARETRISQDQSGGRRHEADLPRFHYGPYGRNHWLHLSY